MRRRKFITLLGGAAATWPLPARAQQPAGRVYQIGYPLATGSREQLLDLTRAFVEGLRSVGYRVGENVLIEYRFADGETEQVRPRFCQKYRSLPACCWPSDRRLLARVQNCRFRQSLRVRCSRSEEFHLRIITDRDRIGHVKTGVGLIREGGALKPVVWRETTIRRGSDPSLLFLLAARACQHRVRGPLCETKRLKDFDSVGTKDDAGFFYLGLA